MGNERFCTREFQLEFLTQKRPELLLDLFGFCFRSGKTQAKVISIPTILEPSVIWVVDVVSWQLLCSFPQVLSNLLLPVLEAPVGAAHQEFVFLIELSLDAFGVVRNEYRFDELVEQDIAQHRTDDRALWYETPRLMVVPVL